MSSNICRFCLLTILLILVFCLSGCEGPQGPAGEGAGDVDFRDPVVEITQPASTDTVYTSTFYIAANATDNDSIEYVEFLLDGKSDLGGDSLARDYEAPYYLQWTLEGSGHGYGVYPLVAKAVDKSNNVGFSTPRIIFYYPLPAEQTLSFYGTDSDNFGYRTLPDTYTDKYFNVRFTPLDTCQVIEIHFEFLSLDGAVMYDGGPALAGPCDMDIYFWQSENKLPATTPLYTRRVSSDALNFDDGWTIIDVSDVRETLAFAGDFHAGFSPPDEDYENLKNANLALPLAVTLDAYHEDDPTDFRSSELDPTAGWGTIQQHYDVPERVFDLHIRVRVAYPNGQTELIDNNISRGVIE